MFHFLWTIFFFNCSKGTSNVLWVGGGVSGVLSKTNFLLL